MGPRISEKNCAEVRCGVALFNGGETQHCAVKIHGDRKEYERVCLLLQRLKKRWGNLVRVYAASPYYTVMELVHQTPEKAGLTVTPRTIVTWGIQIMSTLHSMHENGVVHGDIKRQNLGFTENGDIVIMDLGSVHACQRDRVEVANPLTTIFTRAPGPMFALDAAITPGNYVYRKTDDVFSAMIVLMEMAFNCAHDQHMVKDMPLGVLAEIHDNNGRPVYHPLWGWCIFPKMRGPKPPGNPYRAWRRQSDLLRYDTQDDGERQTWYYVASLMVAMYGPERLPEQLRSMADYVPRHRHGWLFRSDLLCVGFGIPQDDMVRDRFRQGIEHALAFNGDARMTAGQAANFLCWIRDVQC